MADFDGDYSCGGEYKAVAWPTTLSRDQTAARLGSIFLQSVNDELKTAMSQDASLIKNGALDPMSVGYKLAELMSIHYIK